MHLRPVRVAFLTSSASIFATLAQLALGAQPPLPSVTEITARGPQKSVSFTAYPAAASYTIQFTPDLSFPFADAEAGAISGFTWTGNATTERGFFRVKANSMPAADLANANLLNRIAYGPSPDELVRLAAIGPDAFIAEQLAPELIQEQLEIDKPTQVSETGWRYITATGTGSASTLYIYLNAAGQGYIDDIKLVEGSVAGVGNNLLRNGDFESPLTATDWTISTNHAASALSTEYKHSGASSLKLVASAAGTTRASSVWQDIRPALSSSRSYTLSFWFLPDPAKNVSATVRLSGDGILTTTAGTVHSQLEAGEASINTLRAYHVTRAIQSRRQLLEVLLQFFENHFVTEYTKSRDYFDASYDDPQRSWLATQTEYKELQRWRQALLAPQCTFYDLLKISAESPAMIIYLDTVSSRGDGGRIANENYARELLELFTFGVDNGYDQNDIVEISKTWTGWTVGLLAAADEFNPHATRLNDLPQNRGIAISNLVGVWSFKYRPERHDNRAKLIFPGKTVPARFGAPYAGRSYELRIAAAANTPTTIQEGYTVIRHLADQPFTQEYLSVKLCQWLVHDGFHHGYDFTDPNLSEEGQLVRRCMEAWENGSPKGQIRQVLRVILDSELFRSHAGSMQKVKTPLEFVVSSIRALRADLGDGTHSATTDGNIHDILNRMGSMRLFDRAEPDGYPEAGPPWISAGTLAERLRFAQSFLMAPNQRTSDAGNSSANPVALLKARLPQANWSNSGAVADYFLRILFPAEGKANLDLYRQAAVQFLDTTDDGLASSPFANLNNAAAAYDTRVRGMVAMLLTLPRFQEQ